MMHCWQDEEEWIEKTRGSDSSEYLEYLGSATCMLPEKHDGPHKFVPDDQITITITDKGRRYLKEHGLDKG